MIDVVVLLHAREGADVAGYERAVIPIMREHGAEILSAFVPRRPPEGGGPDEVHVLRFPSEAAFAAYRADPRVTALAERREAVIRRTDVYVAERFREY